MKHLLFLLLLATACFACGDANETADATDRAMTDAAADVRDGADDMANSANSMASNGMAYLTSTINAVKSAGGDLTALSPSAATQNIDGWVDKLSSMDGTDAIVGNLKELKEELMSGDIDGGDVSELLGKLANDTRSLSSKAPALNGLANALQAGADKLGGM